MPVSDPRKFPPHQLVKLLNSFPNFGTVTTVARLRKHREQAGLRISADGSTVDWLRYCAWLVSQRHTKAHQEPNESKRGTLDAYRWDKHAALTRVLASHPLKK